MAHVIAVCRSASHNFAKGPQLSVRLEAGLGVVGDAHAGATARHRARVRRNPDEINLRQVHLIHAELHDELNARGFAVSPGLMGENITTRGVDLLGLGQGALLQLGDTAVIEITGLRSPCSQLDKLQPGLLQAVIERAPDAAPIFKSGVMSIVRVSGEVRPGDAIVTTPPGLHRPLAPV